MKIISIGCSFTEGQGLERQAFECYTTKLAEKLNLEFFNFGSVGSSNDYIFRKFFELVESNIITKNDIIIIQWTHYLRKELPILVNNKRWFHTIPNSYHANQDKKLIRRAMDTSVQSEYMLEDLHDVRLKIEKENKELLESCILKFLNEEYQKDTTKNYINSLYTYCEHFGYKHIHFFGWEQCVINAVFQNKTKFLKETFGEYTNTVKNAHPDKFGHLIWSNFLHDKLVEFNYHQQNKKIL